MSERKGLFGLFNIDSIVDHLYGFIDSKIEVIKIEAKEEAAHILAKLVVFLMLSIFILFLLIFISFYAANKLNEVFSSESTGYLIVSGLYLFLFVLTLVASKAFELESKLKDVFIKFINREQNEKSRRK